MSNTIYLYLKTHNATGLKYLGKTVRDPYEYRGSGLVWNRHLDKHGDDVTTEILFETTDMEEFKRVGLEYSEKWNIVESKEFANLVNEQGAGGDTFSGKTHSQEAIEKIRKARDKQTFSSDTRRKMSEARKGKSHSEETKKKISKAGRGRKNTWAKPHTEETKKKMSEAAYNRPIVECSHCGKTGDGGNMKRWHFDNCREKI
jgi:hypothetical protein